MKIGIDLLPLQSDPKRRGISNFAYNTIKELLVMDRINQYFFFNARDVNTDFIRKWSHTAQLVDDGITPERSADLDLFIFTSVFDFEKKFIDPAKLKCKIIAIVYDIIPIVLWDHYIEFFPQKIKFEYFRRIARIRECDKILTISQAVKRDLVEILEIPERSIDVIYAGIDHNAQSPVNESQIFAQLKEKFQIRSKYIFSVPSMDVRKNIFGLIAAYGLLPPPIKDEYQLVISNEMTPDFEKKLHEHARKTNIPDSRIIFTNYVSDEELRALYKNSSLFVFPSFYEGFGLPVLESMHYGIPVITSNNSSLPEVVGDAGILVNPYNTQEISDAMVSLLSDVGLQGELSEKAKVQSKKFSWTDTAQRALKSCQEHVVTDPILRLGMVTPWNVKCGIAEYSKFLIGKLPDVRVTVFASNDDSPLEEDGLNVVRCWDTQSDIYDRLFSEILRRKVDVVHFQFNFGFFRLPHLLHLKDKLQKSGIRVMITFHGTQDVKIGSEEIKLQKYGESLQTFDRIIVHTDDDRKRLNDIGIYNNMVVIPQGIKSQTEFQTLTQGEDPDAIRYPVIATFGFCLPHKGILEAIQAISLLKKEHSEILFLVVSSLYPVSASQSYLDRCMTEVQNLGLTKNVRFFPEFMNENRVFALLRSADVIIMPYTGSQESSSAAVKFTCAAMKPLLVTDLPIFNEYTEEVLKIPRSSPEAICQGIREILGDKTLRENLVKKIGEKMARENWDVVAQQYKELLCNVLERHPVKKQKPGEKQLNEE